MLNNILSIYCYTDYLYNILEHELVPEHIVLSDEEKEKKETI